MPYKQNSASASDMEANLAFLRGVDYVHKGNYQQAILHLTDAANLGHVEAQKTLGIIFLRGWGVPVDYQKAGFFLKKAEKSGCKDVTPYLKELEKKSPRSVGNKGRVIGSIIFCIMLFLILRLVAQPVIQLIQTRISDVGPIIMYIGGFFLCLIMGKISNEATPGSKQVEGIAAEWCSILAWVFLGGFFTYMFTDAIISDAATFVKITWGSLTTLIVFVATAGIVVWLKEQIKGK